MKRLNFNCKFITDVVLNSTAATEGNNTTLDYIPGSAFLGIAANEYGGFGIDAFNVFHSGNVRFSDGHPFETVRCFRMPASYFVKKGESLSNTEKIFIHHQITQEQKEDLRRSGTQLKQQRSGFFEPNGISLKKIELSKDFNIKSAYDRNKRRAKDKMMFGYEYLKCGSEWSFYIEVDTENETLSSKIKNSLMGTKRLGRSKTAEFGLVEITFINEESIKPIINSESGKEIILYADSLLAFVNEFGMPTLTPKAKDFGIEGDIVWEKCQILTRYFAPYNTKRETREADRICIDKGSVFVITVEGSVNNEKLTRGVGIYLNEGFGKIVVNPDFLTVNSIKISNKENGKPTLKETSGLPQVPENLQNIPLMKYLQTVAKQEQAEFHILEEVDVFINKNFSTYRKIKPSQWGSIRERASGANSKAKLMEILFGEVDGKTITDKGYLTHGVATIDWNERNRLSILKDWIKLFDEENCRTATIVLAAAIAKKYNQK
jgi:hypothetical protein